MEHGLDNFQLAYNEMKYHGWLDEDEDESISNFILLIKQELKNENTNNDVHSSLILKE